MARVRVDIKWDATVQKFCAYDENNGVKLTAYVELTYGDPDTFPTDSPTEAAKTTSNGQPATGVTCKGWVTV